MNKNEAMQEIETIRARLTVLEKIVQEDEKPMWFWKPAHGEIYWFVADSGGLKNKPWWGNSADKHRFSAGNCFRTREAAEKAAPLFARAHKVIQAALMADPED